MLRLYSYRFKREGLILESDVGWGEIAPLPGFSAETLDEARAEILAFLEAGKEPKLPSVRFGLSSALKPFSYAPLSTPLCALNDPRVGFSTLKLKLKDLSLEEAIAKARTLKDRFRLRLDCNRAWSLEQALQFASHFKPGDFDYLEEPVAAGLAEFSKQSGFPLAADESLRDGSYKEVPTVKAAIVKPTLMGEIPKLALPIVLSSSFETSLGILQIARLAQNNLPQGLDTFEEDLLDPPLKREKGHLVWEGSKNPINMKKLCRIY